MLGTTTNTAPVTSAAPSGRGVDAGPAGTGLGLRVPSELREAARFPAVPQSAADAAAWARVLVVAAKQLAAGARDASTWSHETQTAVVGALDEVGRLAVAAKSPVLAAQEARGAWRQAGVRTFEDFRASATRAGRGAARREVNAARAVHELDGGLDALASGALTPVHAERLGAITGRLPEAHKQALLSGEGAARVKRLAQRFDAGRFASKVEDLAAELSTQRVEEDFQDARRRRHLELSPTADGMTRITGLLDPVAGHTLQVALDAVSPRPAADDERTRAQRQADALHALASAMLGEQKSTGHARPHVLITMTADTFRSAREHLREGGSATGPAPAARYQDGPLLPLSEIGRTLCDSQIARLVVNAESEPLDLGRSQRLFTPAQRRAVIARDGGCAWEGCTTPSRYGEVHHLDWWDEDHGHTDVSRGVLLCVFHHHELHRHGLDLVKIPPGGPDRDGPDGPDGARPPGDGPPDDRPPDDRPRYRTVPRARTRAAREAAKRERLLDGARTASRLRKSGRGDP